MHKVVEGILGVALMDNVKARILGPDGIYRRCPQPKPGELIYDPFCGSGSTIVAAHQLGRTGYGCEIDPAYLAVELERISLLGLKPELEGQS